MCNANSNITKGENAKNMKDVQCQVQRSGKNCTVGRSEIVEKLTPSDNLPSFLCHRSEFEFGAVPKWKSRTRLKTKVEEDRCVGGSYRCLRHPDQMQQRGQKISLIKNCLPETIGSQVTVTSSGENVIEWLCQFSGERKCAYQWQFSAICHLGFSMVTDWSLFFALIVESGDMIWKI